MKLIINGKEEILEQEKITISDLLKIKNVEMPDMVSVQLNEEFVEKNNYQEIYLKDGDVIDFLYFMGGGS
ncbi:MAG: sulfur carrier protein ThiS [Melioribacter sp.]|uniref:sulfur carrier protein ThiS n=1 Tax=Rosettibacter primus TaxID=3111523 RepID=UPI00247DE172|nr:sulfur carrier protein ThiS [Melioribacter sp.]